LGVPFTVTALAGAQIRVNINGNPVHFNHTKPVMIDYHVMVPMRGTLEQMGAQVSWNQAEREVTTTLGSTVIRLHLGDVFATLDGQSVAMDAPAIERGSHVLVPLRFLSEALGASVAWDDEQQLVSVDTTTETFAFMRPDAAIQNPAPASPQTVVVALPAPMPTADLGEGTVIPVVLTSGLRSDTAHKNDTFVAEVRGVDPSNYEGLPNGTLINGHVSHVHASDQYAPGMLGIAFDSLRLPDGTTEEINGSLIALDNQYVVNTGGRLSAKLHRSASSNMKFLGYGSKLNVVAIVDHNRKIDNWMITEALRTMLGKTPSDPQRFHNVVLVVGTPIGIRLSSAFVRNAAQ
jgi:hypothetical protein